MIIGDPYKFAVMFDEVESWNYESDCHENGHVALCLDGKMFPNHIVNGIISTSLSHVAEKLQNIPEDAELFSMDSAAAFERMYDLVYLYEPDFENDYRFELSPETVSDAGCFAFVVKCGSEVRILGSKLEYDRENSRHIFDGIEVTEIRLDDSEISDVVKQIKEYLSTAYEWCRRGNE